MTNQTTPPDGWDEVGIFDLVSIASGQVDPRHPDYRDLPLIAPDHIESGTGRLLNVRTAAQQKAISGKYLVEPGDVIYSKIRPYLQKVHLIDFRGLCSADMYPLRPKRGVSGEFILNTLLSSSFTNFAVSTSMRSGIPKINRADLGEYRLFAPGSGEQRAIGEALSDSDLFVARLEQLAAKRRAINLGLMQELLTGRTRLPGFTDDWKSIRLGNHVSYVRNIALSRAQLDNQSCIKYLHYGDIHAQQDSALDTALADMPRVPKTSIGTAEYLAVGDLVFADASEDLDGVGKSVEISAVADPGTIPGLHTITARFDKTVLADGFKAYLQRIPAFRAQLLRLVSGTKVLATTRAQLSSIELVIPGSEEQRQIAIVLRDAEAGIAAIESRLDSARAIRKGMMQELLTGRTRLLKEVTA